MRSRLAVGLTAAVGLVLSLSACSDDAAQKPDTLPQITLPVIDANGPTGDELDLSSLRGPAVVNVWAYWCQPCRKELPLVQEFHQRHPEVEVLGIDYTDQTLGEARSLMASAGITYRNVYDETGEINNAGAFPRLQALPVWMVLDADGTVVHTEYVEMKSVEQIEKAVEKALPGVLEDAA